MTLTQPFMITARLMAGVKVDKTFISIEPAGATKDGRLKCRYYIDTPEWEFEGDDLASGVGGPRRGLQEMMESLLSFLSSAADSYRYHMSRPKGEHDDPDLFPPHVMEWCYQHDSELSMLQLELEDNPNLITNE